ncbi:MAG: DUF5985 family protein [Steroidobacteraceae bacterium]
MKQFLWGLLTMQTAVVALFFFRYWRTSGDRLFLYFGLSFVALALNWIGLSSVDPALELRHLVYLFRLLAFVLIIVGIIDKNRRRSREP